MSLVISPSLKILDCCVVLSTVIYILNFSLLGEKESIYELLISSDFLHKLVNVGYGILFYNCSTMEV